jgi:hypothetical protein
MADRELVRLQLERNLAQAESLGDEEWAGQIRARLGDEIPEAPSMSNTKAELLEAAEAAGVEADESMTKAEILEALEE